MKLRDLLKDVSYRKVQGNLDIEVSDIAYDSRKVNENIAFVALKGFRVDGHDYIDKAIELGCKVVIVCDDVIVDKSITVIKLEDTRVDLSKISRTLFGYPDEEMTVIAITGTKGKTTTSSMIKKVLDDSGNTCGLIGTMGVFYKDKYYHTVNTSPESYDVFKYMREMLDNGVKHLVMEISSQSLKLKRWSNVVFDYSVFTNLSLDHVGDDEHESFDDYMYCKSLLFKQSRVGIFNIDSEYYEYMSGEARGSEKTYGFGHIGTDEKLFVFESPIDLLSYITVVREDWEKHSYISLGGLSEKAMKRMYTEYPHIHSIYLCLDNDEPGNGRCRQFVSLIPEELSVYRLEPVKKDWNECLVAEVPVEDMAKQMC